MWYFSSPEWADHIALEDSTQQLSYQQMANAIDARTTWIKNQQVKRVAIAIDNSIEWVLFDLACQQADICCVPVPSFFSPIQTAHLLEQSAIELLLTEKTSAQIINTKGANHKSQTSPFKHINATYFPIKKTPVLPNGTHKITFTSGTTGNPKGVCLSFQSQLNVAQSLVDAVSIDQVRHLCLLPLATLLENIAGVYAPLLVGGTVVLANQTERGFSGSRLSNPQQLLVLISQQQPNSLILVPELLSLLVSACAQGWRPPKSLQFIAVGGGKVAVGLLNKARALGLPVYQGYGLSECASVVALNTQQAEMLSSAGKVLPHNTLRVDDGELIVTGNLFLGYLNQPESFYPSEVRTGDLVSLDGDFLTIEGRRKNVIINSFGRNLSPEWVEAELMATGLFRDVLVFGDDAPHCGALITPARSDISEQDIRHCIDQANQSLPDYAQVAHWIKLEQPLATIPNLTTATGKPIRDTILTHFNKQIHALYHPESTSTLTGASL